MEDELYFREIISKKKIPILVLDQKWHRLFDADGKSAKIKSLENQVNQLVGRQGKINQEMKDLKRLKSTLMNNVMDNMDGTGVNVSNLIKKKLDEDKRLITEINERIEDFEDELEVLPGKLQEVNGKLMFETLNFCYDALKDNSDEIRQISKWIKQVRIELKKNILVKQNREINNRSIYSYLHDMLGAQAVDMIDTKIGDIQLGSPDNTESEV